MQTKKNISILFVYFFTLTISWGQTGPAGVGTNDGSSDLKMWLDAGKGVYEDLEQSKTALNGNRIKFWSDLSGSHNDVRVKSDTNRPEFFENTALLNHQNALRFYRHKDTLTRRTHLVSESFSKTNDITMYCVFHASTKSGGNNSTPVNATTYNPNLWYNGSGLIDAGVTGIVNDISLAFCDSSLAAGAGDTTTKTDYCVKTPVSINKTYFALLEKQAWNGILSISQNNAAAATFQAGTQPINNAYNYFIGSTAELSFDKKAPFFDGYIATVLIYNRILTLVEKIILENYLAAKYNLPLFQNDIYTFDNTQAGDFDHELVGIGKASDGSAQLSAKGEGIVEINNAIELDKGDFIFVAHNNKSLTNTKNNVPEGVLHRLERNWVLAQIGKTKTIDLTLDPAQLSAIEKNDLVLLIDTNNDGSFSDEKLGVGIVSPSETSTKGRLVFRGLKFKHGNQFTFAQRKPQCETNCDTFFSPDGDGIADSYFIKDAGKTNIFNRSGKLIKSLQTPAFWDGTNENGEASAPGIYFLLTNEQIQKTVTLIK